MQTIINGPIMRLFEVKAKPGCAGELLEKFARTSAEVVAGQPGSQGYFFGQGIKEGATVEGDDTVIFASLWQSMEAVKARFGAHWQQSFLPPGYENLIESCSIRHIDLGQEELGGGWHAQVDTA